MDDIQWLAGLRPGDKLIRVWLGQRAVVTVDHLTRTLVRVHLGRMPTLEQYHRVGPRITQRVGDVKEPAPAVIRQPAGNEAEFIDLVAELAQELGLIDLQARPARPGISVEHLTLDDLRDALAHARALVRKLRISPP